MPTVTVLIKPEGCAWTREESHLMAAHFGCHVERWSKFPNKMVLHSVAGSKDEFISCLGHGDFVVNRVSDKDMWNTEKTT